MDEQRGDGGAHPARLGVVLGRLKMAGRPPPRRPQHRRERRSPRWWAAAKGCRRGGSRLRGLFLDGLDGDARGGPAAGVAAHAVGDDEQAELLVDEEAVLVVVAPPADVGRAPGLERKSEVARYERRGSLALTSSAGQRRVSAHARATTPRRLPAGPVPGRPRRGPPAGARAARDQRPASRARRPSTVCPASMRATSRMLGRVLEGHHPGGCAARRRASRPGVAVGEGRDLRQVGHAQHLPVARNLGEGPPHPSATAPPMPVSTSSKT